MAKTLLIRGLTFFVLFVLLWASLASVTGAAAMPNGNLFTLLLLFIVAKLVGMAVDLVKVPPLLGMLVVGIILSSIPGLGIYEAIDNDWSRTLRSMALTVILLMAGLGLDPEALKKLSFMVFRLAFTPCIVEASVVATLTWLILGFPWLWGFMLGFVLGAVTPAVVVPCLLVLSEKGYGVEKGIPTLVIAASSVDDVLAISGFTVLYGINFAAGAAWWTIVKALIEVGVGVAYGAVLGAVGWVLPSRNDEDKDKLRFYYLIGVGVVAIFGSEQVSLPGAGALGCLVAAFVAGIGWRKQGMQDENPTNDMLNSVWDIFQPLLFVLIGTEIKVGELDMATVGWGVIVLCISLVFRMICSFSVVMGGGLTFKERLFVAFAWLPKATVQAAIGSTALDYARSHLKKLLTNHDEALEVIKAAELDVVLGEQAANGSTALDYARSHLKELVTNRDEALEVIKAAESDVVLGEQVLTIAVLSILITAPIGAIAIMLMGPKLLSQSTSTAKEPDEVIANVVV